jgi:hypothetical protein
MKTESTKLDARDNEKLFPYEKVPCKHCQEYKTFEGHDGCLGTLDGIANACCNHGGHGEGAYVQFYDGVTIHGEDAILIQEILKRNRSNNSKMDRLAFLAGSVKYIAQEIQEMEKMEENK